MPKTSEEWLTVANDFETLVNFQIVFSMNGKYIKLQGPINSGNTSNSRVVSKYYNYKDLFSLVLFTLVNTDYNFLLVDCRC